MGRKLIDTLLMNSSVLDIRETIVPSFCDEKVGKIRGILVPFAAELVVVTKLSTISEATAHMSQMLGRKISKRTVEETLKKIREGHIKVMPEDVRRAAQTHPLAARLFEYCPELADPAVFDEQIPKRHKPQTSAPSAEEPRRVPQPKTWERDIPAAARPSDHAIPADHPDAESIRATEDAVNELLNTGRPRNISQ